MMLRLVGGELEAQIDVIKKNLSTASAFERIARLCVEGHQVERAITWAEKGLRIFPRRDARLVQLVRDLYEQVGRHEELAKLAFDAFVEKLDVATYAALKSACSSDAWTGWRAKAVRHVEIQLAQSLKARTKIAGPSSPTGRCWWR